MEDLPCWEIMKCNDEHCLARKSSSKACWEIVRELGDYRAGFDVCKDCLVYVLKTGSLHLSDQEMEAMASSKNCVLANGDSGSS